MEEVFSLVRRVEKLETQIQRVMESQRHLINSVKLLVQTIEALRNEIIEALDEAVKEDDLEMMERD